MDEFVENILKKWNLADLVERFRDEEVNEEAFLFLTPDIIKELIPKLGKRAIFIGRFNELKKSLQRNDDQSSSIDCPSPSPVDPKSSQQPKSMNTFAISEVSTENPENNDKQFENYFLEQLTSTPSTNTPPVCVSIPNAANPDASPSDTEDDPTAKRIKLEVVEADEYGDSILLEDNSQDSLSVLVENDRTMNRMMNDPDVPGVQKLRLLMSQSRLTRNLVNQSKLEKCQRTDLTNVVVHYIIARELGNNPTQGHKRETFNYWADAIVGLFPNERKMTYYSGMDGCTGKLHQRYLSVLRNKRNEDYQEDLGEGSSLLNLDDFNVEPIPPRYATFVTREEERALDDVKRIVSSCFVMRDTRHSRTLSPNQRNILTANIVNYLMDKNGGPILNEELEYFAKAIEKVFPEENASIYFRRQGNNARVYGKLFDRYGYMKRKRSLAQGKPYNDFLDSSSPIGQMWEMKTVEEARALWNETHKARKEVTRKVVPAKLFEKFPFLAQPDGYTLFVDDFDKDHPTAIGMFKQTWPEFATNIYRYIQENNFLLSVTEFSTDDSPKRMDNNYTIVEIVEGNEIFLYTLPSKWVIKNGWNRDVTNDSTNSGGADLCYWPNSVAGYRLFERAKADPIVPIVQDAVNACRCKIKNSNFTTYEEAYLEQQMMEIDSALENHDKHRELHSGPESLAVSSKPAENGPESTVVSDTQKSERLEAVNLVPRTTSVDVQVSLPSPHESKVEILQDKVNRIMAEFEAFKFHIKYEFAKVNRMNSTPAESSRLPNPASMVLPPVASQAVQPPVVPEEPLIPVYRPIPNCQPPEGLLSPVKNLEDLEALQECARDDQFVETIVQSLGSIHGKDRCIGNGWTVSLQTVDFFFDRRFLLRCSWTGSGRNKEKDGVKISKIAFHKYDKVINLFYRVVLHSDPLFTYNDCLKFLHRCVRNAKARADDVKRMRQSVARNRKKRTDPVQAVFNQMGVPSDPTQLEPPEEFYYQVEPLVKEEYTEDNSHPYDVL